MRIDRDDPRITWPLFTLAEAAGYLNMPPSTLASWVRAEAGGKHLVTSLPFTGHQPRLPFIGFAEAFVLQAARHAGVPAHRIRPNVEAIREQFPSIDHALASRRIYTDGAELLVMDEGEDADVAEVPRLHQRQMTQTVKDQLRLIDYGQDGFARRLTLPKYDSVEVRVDPLLASGRPLLQGVRIKDLTDRFSSGDRKEEIAEAFGISVQQVSAVVGNP